MRRILVRGAAANYLLLGAVPTSQLSRPNRPTKILRNDQARRWTMGVPPQPRGARELSDVRFWPKRTLMVLSSGSVPELGAAVAAAPVSDGLLFLDAWASL